MNLWTAVCVAPACIGLALVYLYGDKKYRLTGREAAAAGAVCTAAVFVLFRMGQNGAKEMETAEFLWALTLLMAAACTDMKERIVPNRLTALGFLGRCILWAVRVWRAEPGQGFAGRAVLGDLVGTAGFMAVLLALAVISRGALGFGDVKLLVVVCLLCGPTCAWTCFACGMGAGAAVSFWVLTVKKAGRKYKIPLVPCFLAGFLTAALWQTG